MTPEDLARIEAIAKTMIGGSPAAAAIVQGQAPPSDIAELSKSKLRALYGTPAMPSRAEFGRRGETAAGAPAKIMTNKPNWSGRKTYNPGKGGKKSEGYKPNPRDFMTAGEASGMDEQMIEMIRQKLMQDPTPPTKAKKAKKPPRDTGVNIPPQDNTPYEEEAGY